jgi:alkanesulfonate monooxygenase SsuD/methylene tetrahydromethanopterin reductase-like flavin-dependent oxidoreductase (luciferase family)
MAGQRGWIPISINFLPVEGVKRQWQSVEYGAIQSGIDAPDRAQWRIARDVFVAETAKEARKQVLEGSIARAFEGYFLRILSQVPGRIQQLKIDPEMPDRDVTPEYLADNIWIVGGPDEVEAKLRRLHHDVGGFGVLVTTGHEWKPKQAWRESHELLAKVITPRLADLN